MIIKGDINKDIYVRATIRGISIDETGEVTYLVNTKQEDDLIPVLEKDIIFETQKKESKKEPKKEPKEEKAPEQEVVKKRRGRPRMATPESTMAKLERMRDGE